MGSSDYVSSDDTSTVYDTGRIDSSDFLRVIYLILNLLNFLNDIPPSILGTVHYHFKGYQVEKIGQPTE